MITITWQSAALIILVLFAVNLVLKTIQSIRHKPEKAGDLEIKITVDSTEAIAELERLQKEIAKIKIPTVDKRQKKDL